MTVEIDGSQATLEEAVTGGWIAEQLKRRERDGRRACVCVRIDGRGVNLALKTPACPTWPSAEVPRPPTPREKENLDLWAHHGLNDHGFTPGNVQAALRRLSQIL